MMPSSWFVARRRIYRNTRYISCDGNIRTPVAIVGSGPTGLMLSILLSQYNISSTLLDAKKEDELHLHPQAHYLNLRTMEILRHCVPFVYEKVVKQAPQQKYWQAFNFSHSVMGRQIARVMHPVEGIKANQNGNGILVGNTDEHVISSSIDGISETYPAFASRCSDCDPIHLAQNKFTKILLEEARRMSHLVTSGSTNIIYGEPVTSVEDDSNSSSSMKLYTPNREIKAQYVIAADGANSGIRKDHDGKMIGDMNIQSLINVHFKTSDFFSKLLMRDKERCAMLHFVFNTKVVGVFVCHDVENGEWVLQIPFFPPFQSPDEFSQHRIEEMVLSGLLNHSHSFYGITSSDISILSIKPWSMSASVAHSYFLGNRKRIILAGDSAHVFPPAGGFGMNTGIQDAHNLAWRLALAIQSVDQNNNSVLQKYEEERRPIASQNAALSVRNYSRTLNVVKAVNLDPNYPYMLRNMLLNPPLNLLPISSRSKMFHDLTNIAFMSLSSLEYEGNIYGDILVKSVRRILGAGGGLPLLFPRYELGFAYGTSNALSDDDDTSGFVPRISPGFRMPHTEVVKISDKRQLKLSTTDLGDHLLRRWLDPKSPSMCVITYHSRKHEVSLRKEKVRSWASQKSLNLDVTYVNVFSQKIIEDIDSDIHISEAFVDINGAFKDLLSHVFNEVDKSHFVAILLRPDGHIDDLKVFKD